MHIFKPVRSGVVLCPFFRRCRFTRAPQGGPRLSWAWILVAMLPGAPTGVSSGPPGTQGRRRCSVDAMRHEGTVLTSKQLRKTQCVWAHNSDTSKILFLLLKTL